MDDSKLNNLAWACPLVAVGVSLGAMLSATEHDKFGLPVGPSAWVGPSASFVFVTLILIAAYKGPLPRHPITLASHISLAILTALVCTVMGEAVAWMILVLVV